eukprot:CAMPEP_0201218930 /NCGR_PEP_ID=MMETSP0851-20130426/190824_1 /ASSEMBLY_ACC=CAM_ASM_000631 /TAXON_ID=183588 /ORGANISM="Pseudo-nitzschia fraudulenta, Strain WWA7" /LENGTH=600 /DNA_ID=CAMNT_0047508619 /DNA_START=201 /DNA_END=2000 /DNA_ORIENTATION=+
MATPVSTDSPPDGHVRTESEQQQDLQAKVQRMISLQYQQQKLSNPDSMFLLLVLEADHAAGLSLADPDSLNNKSGGGGLAKRRNTRTNINLQRLGDVEDNDAGGKALHPSSENNASSVPPSKKLPDVGKGTIVFSGSLRGSKYALGGGVENVEDDTASPAKFLPNVQQQHQQQMSPPSTTLGSQQHQNLLSSPLPQQLYADYGSVQEQNHEFHYGNPDYQNIDEADYYYDEEGGRYQRSAEGSNVCSRACVCLFRPITNILSQENLHRSFCYGAIDGLLTGSGIASAFWGLGLLSVRTRIELRIAVIAFTMAACVADSLCMAMGHVWTTYIVTSNHAWERSYERQQLENDKANSKAKLVDMLLDRGMLKIDAMSLADTLEGYPDLFVSALVGDSLLSSGIQDALLDEPADSEYQQQQQHHSTDPATDFDGAGGFLGSIGSWKLPLHFDSDRGGYRDLEAGHVRVVLSESQKEGIFMMFGFAFFSILPSLLWLLLPMWFDTDPMPTQKSQSSYASPYGGFVDDGASVNIPSLIILILSAVIWCLGVWKSRFMDSNWVIFGLETIAVLIVCISSAYGIATLLVYCIGLNDSSGGKMAISETW